MVARLFSLCLSIVRGEIQSDCLNEMGVPYQEFRAHTEARTIHYRECDFASVSGSPEVNTAFVPDVDKT